MKQGFRILILASLVLAACSAVPPATAPLEGAWKLVSYGDPDNPMPAVPGVNTSIKIEDGKISDNVGCNSFSGEYDVHGGDLTFDKVMSTLIACSDPIAEQEGVTFAVLSRSASYVLEGNTLTITSGDGRSVIVLARK